MLHAAHEGVHVMRYLGDIRYTLAPSLDRFLLELLGDDTPPSGFLVDLTETEAIDSTNLGILARLAKRMRQLDAPRVTLVSNREDINEILMSMALDEVFNIVEDMAADIKAGEQVSAIEHDPKAMVSTALTAHRALMALSEHNRAFFSEVVTALEREDIETKDKSDDAEVD